MMGVILWIGCPLGHRDAEQAPHGFNKTFKMCCKQAVVHHVDAAQGYQRLRQRLQEPERNSCPTAAVSTLYCYRGPPCPVEGML